VLVGLRKGVLDGEIVDVLLGLRNGVAVGLLIIVLVGLIIFVDVAFGVPGVN